MRSKTHEARRRWLQWHMRRQLQPERVFETKQISLLPPKQIGRRNIEAIDCVLKSCRQPKVHHNSLQHEFFHYLHVRMGWLSAIDSDIAGHANSMRLTIYSIMQPLLSGSLPTKCKRLDLTQAKTIVYGEYIR